MTFPREGGILLHPTSLPGPFGIGDLGPEAHRFVDFLGDCGLRLWQVLPLGPTGYGNSPYQALSAFAGNHLLIDLRPLVQFGLIEEGALQPLRDLPQQRVDYGEVIRIKTAILELASQRFRERHPPELKTAFETFCHEEQHWLEDFALFMALKQQFGGGIWTAWPPELVHREPAALSAWRERLAARLHAVRFQQFLFFQQWRALKSYAHARDVRIIGDIPIFVAHDSADVWANQRVFFLDESGNPTVVAGVPPDYFSATGQRWGNPLYRWEAMAEDGYQWWLQRFTATLRMVDIVRVDHFRGFAGYWEVPASEPTAVNGRWVQGPGAGFFETIQREMGELPIIAEDLGIISQDVVELRRRFGFPGMRVLQFAFSDDEGARYFLPHNYPRNCVVYTGTHDNDTCVGWFSGSSRSSTRSAEALRQERRRALAYMGSTGKEVHWDFVRLAFASVANTAIVPLQDVLGLGSEARMNLPGRPDGNWEWRFEATSLNPALQRRLASFVELYERDGRMVAESD